MTNGTSRWIRTAGRWLLAFLAALVTGLVATILIGAVAPLLIMQAIYGVDAVYNSPAHGGAILLLTLPIASLVGLAVVVLLTVIFAEAWGPRGEESGQSENPGLPDQRTDQVFTNVEG